MAALDDVLRGRRRRGDDVHAGLEAHAGHAERLAHAVLLVDRVVLRQHVDDLAVLRDVDRLGLFEHRGDVALFDFLVLDRQHALRVQPLMCPPAMPT